MDTLASCGRWKFFADLLYSPESLYYDDDFKPMFKKDFIG